MSDQPSKMNRLNFETVGSLVALLVALLPNAASADQIAKRQNYSRDYVGAWSEGGCKFDSEFIFADTFIERYSEDICYIDKIDEFSSYVEVTATCWHEYVEVGVPTYRLQLTPSGKLVLNRKGVEYSKCGPVPQELIDIYTRENSK